MTDRWIAIGQSKTRHVRLTYQPLTISANLLKQTSQSYLYLRTNQHLHQWRSQLAGLRGLLLHCSSSNPFFPLHLQPPA
jgi:hypothetical protein